MSPGTIALIVVAVSVAAWGLFMANLTIRRQRKAAAASAEKYGDPKTAAPAHSAEAETKPDVTVEKVPEPKRKPLTPGQLAVSRRQFLNRAWGYSFAGFLGFFGMGTLSFLWPKLTGGFGTVINAGNYDDLLAEIGPDNGFIPKFVPEGRFFLTYYEGDPAGEPAFELVNAGDAKMLALYRKCVHLGCSVPHCATSLLFECPCHGSKYRLSGEYYGGPAPRGLDRFPVQIQGGSVMVDTGAVQPGPPRGVNTWEQFAEPNGPLCVPT